MTDQARPILLVADHEDERRERLAHDLTHRFGADYEVAQAATKEEALTLARAGGEDGRPTAITIAAQHLPEVTGLGLLGQMQEAAPSTKRVLLTQFGDPAANDAVTHAVAFSQADGWLVAPWDPAEEWLFPTISELLGSWSRTEARDVRRFEAVRIVDESWSPRTHEMRDLLTRNGLPHGFYPVDSETGQAILAEAGEDGSRLPVALTFDGRTLIQPSNQEVAGALGVPTRPAQRLHDLAIVGSGPAGLAAAVYGASEGLRTIMLEPEAVGGQAGTSSMIRNYLGFPSGVTGAELARRASVQASLFGVNFAYTRVDELRPGADEHLLVCDDGAEVRARAVILATGVTYRRLEVDGLEQLGGAGVFYGSSTTEARALRDQPVFVVGGGNSAGQAALYLAKQADVTLLAIEDELSFMSDYLVRELERHPRVWIRTAAEVIGAGGRRRLESLVVRDRKTGSEETVAAAALFILIGALPGTEWLDGVIDRDDRGYILTDLDLAAGGTTPRHWPLDRPPLPYETSAPGVFAAGDVRCESVKRVASAVGEGSVTVQYVHRHLAHQARRRA